MRKKLRHKEKKKIRRALLFFGGIIVLIGGANAAGNLLQENPEKLLTEYMAHIEQKEYEEMYEMTDTDGQSPEQKQHFIERNSRIYEGIGIKNLKLSNITEKKNKGKMKSVFYTVSFETEAGKVEFDNQANFVRCKEGYKLLWQDSMIYPTLTETDKVQVSVLKAKRGQILDRNGKRLAGQGRAVSVGVVPGKLEEHSLEDLAALLDTDIENIENKLEADWVKDGFFVPVATLQKIHEIDRMKIESNEEMMKEYERQRQMKEIPGVQFSDIEIRTYDMGEAAAHLAGYVQAVTAEDLEKHPNEGYRSDSVIGRSGMEGLYEKELKGNDGCEIWIVDKTGEKKEKIAGITKEDGKDIRLTIDSELQMQLYEQFKEDEGCSVAMDPYTGEILALVSTPSYDNNDFVRGMSEEQWDTLNENEKRPLYNRFRQIWCPGSVFKPVVAGIGINEGILDPNEDFGNEGLSWQKDSSWGDYQVTTLHEYEPVILKNALIYSDNIYFAKVALRTGSERLERALEQLGFNQKLPFEIEMVQSQYSNTEHIETEIQLADSGYGQGQILVNPVHLASIYSAFLNGGNMIKPYLLYEEKQESEIWIPEAFSQEASAEILEGLKGVINDPGGTGYGACREDILLAGKTGTAELKAAKEDHTGTEIGWFAVFTADKNVERPILILSMAENVKDTGGSGYVVKKDKAVLDQYFSMQK